MSIPTRVDYPPVTGKEPCRRAPEVWFPSRDARATSAKRLCRTDCTVREQCLAYALTRNDDGIWGGLDPSERNEMRRQLRTEKAAQ